MKIKNNYRDNNKNYLGLTKELCDRHQRIMSTPMNRWNKDLIEYCKEQSNIYGFCGDALACWVADWLKQHSFA